MFMIMGAMIVLVGFIVSGVTIRHHYLQWKINKGVHGSQKNPSPVDAKNT